MILYQDGSVASLAEEAELRRLWAKPQHEWTDAEKRWYGASKSQIGQDLFAVEITPEMRVAVIAELRTKAAELAPAGRDAFPGMCGVMHTGSNPQGQPVGLYNEEKTLWRTVAVFRRMLDAAEGIELFQPSNGTEGECFMTAYCANCTKDNFSIGEPCKIIGATMSLDIDDEDYPREWRQDGPNGARCTAFEAKP